VALTATDINGVTGTTTQWVSVPLVESFTFTCSALICTFDGLSSQGVISSYGWTFGDGTNAFGSTAIHTYATGGTYTVTLTIVSARGWRAQTSQTVSPNSPPTASFTVTCDRLTCSVNAAGSRDLDGSIVSYGWDFGDGTTGAGITTTHVYRFQGTYAVRLIVTDNRGATGAQAQSVTVSRQPRRP
jgi:PKD repeat protein